MAAQFRHDKTLAENVRRLLRKRLDKAVELLTDPPAEKLTEAVHSARQNFKRLRAFLRLVRPALGRKRFEKENAVFQDAGRALSAVRDAQALLAALSKLLEPDRARQQVSAEAAERVRRELEHDLAAVEQVVTLPARIAPVVAELRAARERLRDDWPLQDDRDDWQLVGNGLRATYHQGRVALKWTQARPDDDAVWHTLRKRVKDLGYQLRALRPLWPSAFKGVLHDLRALAAALGDDHDFVVLRARLLDDPDPWVAPADLAAVTAVIDERRAELHVEVRSLAQRIYLEKPGAFEDRLHALWKVWRKAK